MKKIILLFGICIAPFLVMGQVCQIGSKSYATLGAALAAVPKGGASPTVITLLQNISFGDFYLSNKKITFNLNGKNLLFTDKGMSDIDVRDWSMENCTVDYTGAGTFKIKTTGIIGGINIVDNSVFKVTSMEDCAIFCMGNSVATVAENVNGMVKAEAGGRITIGGNVGMTSAGNEGNVEAEGNGSSVIVNGNVTTADGINAAYALDGGTITIGGNVNTSISVSANGGTVNIKGNVTLSDERAIGADAANGGKITIDGTLTVPPRATYLKVGDVWKKTKSGGKPSASKPGYLEYVAGNNTVWVKHSY